MKFSHSCFGNPACPLTSCSMQMLLALSGWMSGYGGGFPFDKPGDLYGEEKYVGMRVVSLHFLSHLRGFVK